MRLRAPHWEGGPFPPALTPQSRLASLVPNLILTLLALLRSERTLGSCSIHAVLKFNV